MKHSVQKTLTTLALIVAMMTAGAGVQAQTVNMNRYITLTVQSGQQIRLGFMAASDGTPVRIVSGSNTLDITVGTSTSVRNYTSDGTTMTVYGDITKFDCGFNEAKLTSLDVSNNTALTYLDCYGNRLTSLNVSGCTVLTYLNCYSNKLTSLNVSGCTALTKLFCSRNQLTSLNVSGCKALTYLSCYGNHLSACALDELFRTLPASLISDNAKVFIKDGSYTNPGADGCQTPIANAKNWKVMEYNGSSSNSIEINNTDFTCGVVNTNRYITLTVQSGQQIRLDVKAASAGTPVRIVSGSNTQDITVGTSWTGFQNYIADGSNMKVYGDITGFDCSGNDANVTSLGASNNAALTYLSCYGNRLTSLNVNGCTDLTYLNCNSNRLTTLKVSGCTALTKLFCSRNQLTSLDVSRCPALTELSCYENNMDACALDALFHSLPQHQTSDDAKVFIKDGSSTNPGAGDCRTSIAKDKNWKVMDYNGALSNSTEINNSNYTCVPNMNRYITLTVRSMEAILIDLKAASAATPVRIVSGSNTQDVSVGTSWIGFQSYIADGSNMKVYGDITGFDCSGNDASITAIDIRHNTGLTVFSCAGNQLTSLDVSGCTGLTVLSCYGNRLTSLDVSRNTDLNSLFCHDNNFSTAALDAIYCALPDRSGKEEGMILPVFNASSGNHATVLATTKGNATSKNWKVLYSEDDTDIPATTGNYMCVTSVKNMPVLEAVQLYPNPVENVLYIKAEDEVRSIHIYNVYGAEVISATATKQIDLSGLPAGVYVVRVITEQGSATQRVVKK